MKNDQNLRSWKDSFRLALRGLRFFFKRYPEVMISKTVSIAWRYFTPYVGIHLSALVIEELSGARDVKRLQFLILWALITAAVIAAGTALLRWWENYHGTGWWYKVEHIYGEKLLQMDFVDLDTPEIAERLSRIRDNANGPGMGIYRMLENYEEFLRHAMGLLGGVSLTVTLFISRVPESAGAWTILNNPLFILLIIAVMLAITYISPALHNKAQSYWSLNADKHTGGNRLYGFYTFLGGESGKRRGCARLPAATVHRPLPQ